MVSLSLSIIDHPLLSLDHSAFMLRFRQGAVAESEVLKMLKHPCLVAWTARAKWGPIFQAVVGSTTGTVDTQAVVVRVVWQVRRTYRSEDSIGRQPTNYRIQSGNAAVAMLLDKSLQTPRMATNQGVRSANVVCSPTRGTSLLTSTPSWRAQGCWRLSENRPGQNSTHGC